MKPFTGAAIDRRRTLALALAGGVALAAGAKPSLAAVADGLPTPAARLRAFMLMRGALDDRLVIGFVSGRYYGVVEDEMKPLYGVVAATFARYRLRPDGGYDSVSYEVPFFTDLETGVALSRWLNPYTGESVVVPQTALPPAAVIITPDLKLHAPKLPPGLAVEYGVVSSLSAGPDLWMTEQTTSAFSIPGAPKPIHYGDVVTLQARRADIQAADAKRVPCATAYTSVVSWRPWLKMGDRPGHLMGQGAGRYGVSLEDLPANWHAATAAIRPDVLRDPAGPLKGLLSAWS